MKKIYLYTSFFSTLYTSLLFESWGQTFGDFSKKFDNQVRYPYTILPENLLSNAGTQISEPLSIEEIKAFILEPIQKKYGEGVEGFTDTIPFAYDAHKELFHDYDEDILELIEKKGVLFYPVSKISISSKFVSLLILHYRTEPNPDQSLTWCLNLINYHPNGQVAGYFKLGREAFMRFYNNPVKIIIHKSGKIILDETMSGFKETFYYQIQPDGTIK